MSNGLQHLVTVAAGLGLTAGLAAGGDSVAPAPRLVLSHGQTAKIESRDELWKTARTAAQAGRSADALAAAQKALDLTRDVYGSTDVQTATAWGFLAGLQAQSERWMDARHSRQAALEILTGAYGSDDWRTVDARLLRGDVDLFERIGSEGRAARRRAIALANEGIRFSSQGDYAAAQEKHRQALKELVAAVGNEHMDVASAQRSLGTSHIMAGEFDKAEPPLRRSLEITRRVFGEQHPAFARTLNGLAMLYSGAGDYSKAEPLMRRSNAIWKACFGESSHEYLVGSGNLALLHARSGNATAAELLYTRVLELYAEHHGKQNIFFAAYENGLGVLYRERRAFDLAKPLLEESLAIRRKVVGPDHMNTVESLNDLALLLGSSGHPDVAKPLVEESLAACRARLGEDHPYYSDALSAAAAVVIAEGDPRSAESHSREALRLVLRSLSRTADIQSESSQMASSLKAVRHLNQYLTTTAGNRTAVDAYALALDWKGQVFVRQRRQRELAEAAADPAAARISADLLVATRRLAMLSGQSPKAADAAEWRKAIDEAAARREELETELARVSAGFRKHKERESLTPGQLRAALPPQTALVDYFIYQAPIGSSVEDRVVAFVSRPDRELARVELGQYAPVAASIEAWRGQMARRSAASPESPGGKLRATVWDPLAAHLEGVQTILVSPDGGLAKFPFAALPGLKPDTFLIEDVAVAVLPVPQFLPDIVAPANPAAVPSLLVSGDVDYDAGTGKPAGELLALTAPGTRGTGGMKWSRLPGTRGEAEAIRKLFESRYPKGRVTPFEGAGATEDAVRKAAPASQFLHLATHGFFSPAGARSTVHPGLLSGLVLAGANQPVDPIANVDDGILTALEVAGLDLRKVDLAVLSACETGLGKAAGGEGTLGLQRAFAVAGARTTVTSLWQVPDKPTEVLMTRLYRNLWAEKKTGRLEALRAAQLWMLKEGAADPGVQRGATADAPEIPMEHGGRLPPYYWAAFVLAGDWR